MFNTVAECLAFIDLVGQPSIRVEIDTFHMNIEEDDLGAAVALAGDRLGHVQVAANNRRPPQFGHIDWTSFHKRARCRRLRRMGRLRDVPEPECGNGADNSGVASVGNRPRPGSQGGRRLHATAHRVTTRTRRLVNDRDDLVKEMLEGYVRANSEVVACRTAGGAREAEAARPRRAGRRQRIRSRAGHDRMGRFRAIGRERPWCRLLLPGCGSHPRRPSGRRSRRRRLAPGLESSR